MKTPKEEQNEELKLPLDNVEIFKDDTDSNYKYSKNENKYLVKTELNKIPYENETKDYIV
jgi:hypothetical protein